MACVITDSEGYLLINNEVTDISLCEYLIFPPTEYIFKDLTSLDIQIAIGFGFGFITICFLLGFTIVKILRVLNFL
jgi:hypothetical protein